jgi:hypothetical protein
MVFAAMERLKHRIHAFRMPIKDKRVFFLVQCAYFLAPIVIGTAVMRAVVPDPEEMRARINPSAEAAAHTAQQAELFQQALDGRLVVDNRGRLTLDGRQVEAPPPLEPVVYRDPRKVNPFAR